MGAFKYITVVFLILMSVAGFSQRKKGKIELKRADVLEGRGKMRVLKGNVVFEQEGTLMYTDSAYFFPKDNAIEAFGKVRIVQPDGGTITSKKLYYDGNTKMARFRDNVVLKDKNSTLTTQSLDYNMANKTAEYNNGATITDPPNTLTSEGGFYNSALEEFDFKRNVKVVNPKDSLTIYSDHLKYYTKSKEVEFLSKSTIISKKDTIIAESGRHNTVSGGTTFKGGTEIRSGDFVISAIKVDHNQKADRATFSGNVRMINKKDDVIILGDNAIHRGDLGYTKVFGNPVMISNDKGDTTFLTADTLINVDKEKTTGEKKLLAYRHSKIFKKDLQSVADSLVYDFKDSVIYFYREPVLWSTANQIFADSIKVQLVNDKIDKMYLNTNSFIISRDTINNYNQVKGRNMTAHFRNDTIRKVDVNGNAESIYFVLEKDTVVTGMNKASGSDMRIEFSQNKVSTISFLKKPEGVFTPPHLIQEPDTRLKGFVWWYEKRPARADVLRQKL
jgi:lipopolysaccharide assembly outer membrane protein LptD (OstA)